MLALPCPPLLECREAVPCRWLWGCKHAGAAWADNPGVADLRPLSFWTQGLTKFGHQHPASVFRCWMTPVSRPRLWPRTSESEGVAGREPCSTFPHQLPWQYALAVAEPPVRTFSSQSGSSRSDRSGTHQRQSARSILFPLLLPSAFPTCDLSSFLTI